MSESSVLGQSEKRVRKTKMYHVDKEAIQSAARHLTRFGDTDVFPHLPELRFLLEAEETVVNELAALDLDSYSPSNAFEALAPKSKYGFRIVHQLPFVDTLLLLACVVDIGEAIEAIRPPLNELAAFSYRFQTHNDGRIFSTDHSFKDWLHGQLDLVQGNLKIKSVVATDISDFYARVNFHRLENLLDEVAPNHGANRFIKKHIKVIRAKQSFGLPVGGSAARLLAELALTDTDNALKNEGYTASRFVDDYRIFLGADTDPYDALAFLAEQLGLNEGLSLNAAKTKVYSRNEFIEHLKLLTTDIAEEAEGAALEALTSDLYFDDEPDPGEVEELKNMNLLGFLMKEMSQDSLDMGRIKVIFRAMKIAKPESAIEYLTTNFSELVVFAKEVVLLMQELDVEFNGCFNNLTETVVDCILSPPASSIQLIKTWLLELFVRGTVPIDAANLKKLEALNSIADKRQLHLIRGISGDKNYFRKQKTAFGQLSPMEQSCFIWGAGCLPKDEYKAWIAAIKPNYLGPTAHEYLKWAQGNQGDLAKKLYPHSGI